MAYERSIEALADPTRRVILEKLRRGPHSVGVLADGLAVTRPAVSQHLRVLEQAGLVQARQEGTRRIYSVDVNGLAELRRYLEALWSDALGAFQKEAKPGSARLEGEPPVKKATAKRPAVRKPASGRPAVNSPAATKPRAAGPPAKNPKNTRRSRHG